MDDPCPTNQNFVMNKKIYIYFCILLFIFIFSQLYTHTSYLKGYNKIKVAIGKETYTLFIANNEIKRQKGLSNIKTMRDNEGMLFIFEKPDYYHFWMKDMKFPLDLIFINGDKVVDVIKNIQPESYPHTITATEKANKVIELNAGEIDKSSLQKETNITFVR